MCAIYINMDVYRCLVWNKLDVLPTSDCSWCVVDQSLDTYMCAMYMYIDRYVCYI